ncbi:hypothetical protein KAJ02_00930, partial [Candidatus Bipolaricaulota bacterium]|nr:hypothetical protein [Candidatus Bipolaricaulota bacterium]
VAATTLAVPFHQSLDYKKLTGVRPARSFDGTNLKYQPMTLGGVVTDVAPQSMAMANELHDA